MVPQPRQLKTQCSSISARTPAQRSQAAPLERDHNTSKASDDAIAPPSEHGWQRCTASANTPGKRPHDGSGLVSVGPWPLILGTFKVASPKPRHFSKSRPSSSSTFVPRTPTLPSARWSSYTPPFSPHSLPSLSPVSGEVETLKVQLATSEPLVRLLMRGRFEAISASRRLSVDIENLQDQQIE